MTYNIVYSTLRHLDRNIYKGCTVWETQAVSSHPQKESLYLQTTTYLQSTQTERQKMLLLQLAVCATIIVNVVPLNIQKRSAYGSVPEEEDETPQVPQTQFGSAPAETFSPVVSAPRHPIPAPQDKTFTELTHQQPQRTQPGSFGPGPEAPRVSQQTFPQYQPQQQSYQPQTQQTFPQPQRPQASGTYFSGQPQQPQQPRPQQFTQTYQQPQTFPRPQPGRTSFGGPVPDAEPVSAPIVSSFKCDNRPYGYYADEENNCDVYHHCNPLTNSDGTVVYQQYSHWCSPGTKFSQGHLVCVHPNEAVECRLSANYYSVNDRFNEIGGPYPQSGRQYGGQPYRPSYSQQPATPNRGSYTSGQQPQQPLSSNTFPQTGLFSSGPAHQPSAPSQPQTGSFSSGPAFQPSAPSRPQTGSLGGGAPGHHDDGPVISGY